MLAFSMLTLALATPARFHAVWRGAAARPLARRAGQMVRAIATAPASSSTTETVDVPVLLAARIQAALGTAFGAEYASADPMLTGATKLEFGDYQCNAALKLAKQLGQSPRDVAATLLATMDVSDLCEAPDIAGPGFINLRLQKGFVEQQLTVRNICFLFPSEPQAVRVRVMGYVMGWDWGPRAKLSFDV